MLLKITSLLKYEEESELSVSRRNLLEKSVAVTRELTVTASGRYPSCVHARQAPWQGNCWSFMDRMWELMLRFYPFLQPFWERNYELGFFRNYVLFFLEENIPPLPLSLLCNLADNRPSIFVAHFSETIITWSHLSRTNKATP